MVVVVKKKGESKDAVFRKFSRTTFEENIIEDVRKKQFYKKPSILRKEKEKERLALKKTTRFAKLVSDKKPFSSDKNYD